MEQKRFGGVVGVDTAREGAGRWSARLTKLTVLLVALLLAAVVGMAVLVGGLAGPIAALAAGIALAVIVYAGVRPWLP